jgi:N6-adenosine-specific RNA methylase IME4
VSCFVVDPPWRFSDKLGRRGAAANYDTLTVEQIQTHCPYRVMVMQPRNAVLFLWRVSSMQREALDVLDGWGFTLKSELVWEKTTRGGKDHFGMGYIVRAAHETCLIATRGHVAVKHHSQRSRFRAPVGRHSEKPDVFYGLVEQLVHGPYVELFSRKVREGWLCMGNELAPEANRVKGSGTQCTSMAT